MTRLTKDDTTRLHHLIEALERWQAEIEEWYAEQLAAIPDNAPIN